MIRTNKTHKYTEQNKNRVQIIRYTLYICIVAFVVWYTVCNNYKWFIKMFAQHWDMIWYMICYWRPFSACIHQNVMWSSDPIWSGPVFCLLLRVSADYAQPITGQVTEVTCPVIGRAQPELTPSKRQKTGPDFQDHSVTSPVTRQSHHDTPHQWQHTHAHTHTHTHTHTLTVDICLSARTIFCGTKFIHPVFRSWF